MSDKRKKHKFDAKREKRRRKKLAEEGRLQNGVEMPRGAVAADLSQQVPNNSYSPRRLFYVDKEFQCVDCGKQEIWSAQQQKWYYEVAKGSLYATANRCRDCRRLHAERRNGRGDPNLFPHVGALLKRIRTAIEPDLLEAGFQLDSRDYGRGLANSRFDYVRCGLILSCLFDPRKVRLVAETMDDQANCQAIAEVALSATLSSLTIVERIATFTSDVIAYAKTFPRTTTEQST